MVIRMQNQKETKEEVQENSTLHKNKFFQMCKDNKKAITAAGIFLVVALTIVFLGSLWEKEAEDSAVMQIEHSTTEAGEETVISVLEEMLEKDAYPEISNLVRKYYQALADGNVQVINSVKTKSDAQEEIKIIKKSEFIENYPVITVYTKKGPVEGSFVAYVYYEIKFFNYNKTVPGLNTLYICSREDGTYYINDSELKEADIKYLKMISAQNDVIDLFNTVQVQYNEVKASDEGLNTFLAELPNRLEASVSEAMAQLAAQEEAEQQENQEPVEVVIVFTVKTTEVVNVRSSDSMEADKIGKTSKGQVLPLLEEKLNGWSKVEFNGKEGFIKTEFLKPEETVTVIQHPDGTQTPVTEETVTEEVTSEETTEEAVTEATAPEEISTEEAIEKTEIIEGKVTDNVNVRQTPSTEGKKLGKIRAGSTIQIIEKQSDGWTKIQYDGKEAYVKSDYVK